MKRKYLYDIVNCIIYKKPAWTSELALINLALTLNKLYPDTGALFGTWEQGIPEGRKRGNTIADRLPLVYREYATTHGFKSAE